MRTWRGVFLVLAVAVVWLVAGQERQEAGAESNAAPAAKMHWRRTNQGWEWFGPVVRRPPALASRLDPRWLAAMQLQLAGLVLLGLPAALPSRTAGKPTVAEKGDTA